MATQACWLIILERGGDFCFLSPLQTLEEENKQLSQEKEDLESELVSTTTNTSESELISLKRIKRDMETKIVDLEDELDESSLK